MSPSHGFSGSLGKFMDSEDAELERDYEAWNQRVKEIGRRIDRIQSRELSVLERAGANRKSLVWLLAVTALGSPSKKWKDLVRHRMNALQNLARRMETLAAETIRQAEDISFNGNFPFYLFGGGMALGMREPKPLRADPAFDLIVNGIRVLAKTNRDRKKKMGLFLRYYSKTDAGVVLLLVRVFMWTRSTKHYRELANLLTDAFEAAGRSDQFTPDQLRMIWNRSGKGMLGTWISFLTEPQEKERADRSLGVLGDIGS